MDELTIPLAKQVGRVPSMIIPLDSSEEIRFRSLMERLVTIDLHQHPMVCPENMDHFIEYLRLGKYRWGYEAAMEGGWSAIATSNGFRGMVNSRELSYIKFEDLVDEIGMMLSDLNMNSSKAIQVRGAEDIVRAKQTGKVGILPTVEHLAIGDVLHRVDVLYGLGIRIGGLTYNLQNNIGSGLVERHDSGLTDFGIEVVCRMNQIGMAIDVSHAGLHTAMDAIKFSQAPIIYSHNAAYTLRPTWRTRKDEELIECSKRGGLIAITAVPNSLSDDLNQNIGCVLDHYDYMVKLVGVDHVAIGTDTLVGDHVGFHTKMLGKKLIGGTPAPYLDGLESPADGKNIIRGFISRGYSDQDIIKIAGGNALSFIRNVVGS